jgi:hypothetical protein
MVSGLVSVIISNFVLAEDKRYVHIEEAHISAGERVVNFSILYGLQWGTYVITQHETIRTQGSFANWTHNPFKPHFDLDGINYNIFAHSYVGHLYYQYYRAQGYGQAASFLWTAISSTAFEFAIETATEQPSFQDLYQTPIFGTLLGNGFERVSFYFHSMDVWPARALGYLFNPFSLIPGSSYGWVVVPVVNPQAPGMAVSWTF